MILAHIPHLHAAQNVCMVPVARPGFQSQRYRGGSDQVFTPKTAATPYLAWSGRTARLELASSTWLQVSAEWQMKPNPDIAPPDTYIGMAGVSEVTTFWADAGCWLVVL